MLLGRVYIRFLIVFCFCDIRNSLLKSHKILVLFCFIKVKGLDYNNTKSSATGEINQSLIHKERMLLRNYTMLTISETETTILILTRHP